MLFIKWVRIIVEALFLTFRYDTSVALWNKRPDLCLCTMYICLTPSNGSPVDQICDWEVVKLAVCVLKNIFPIALLQVKLACQGFLVTRTASKKVRNLRGLQGCSSRVCRHSQQRWGASSQSQVTPKEFTCSTSELRWSTEATCLHIDYVSPTSHHLIWFFDAIPHREDNVTARLCKAKVTGWGKKTHLLP